MEKQGQAGPAGLDTMTGWTLDRYTPSAASEWDEFTERSRNGTFLFRRGYMDYHADRFTDCSWMARRNGRLRALLPANLTPDNVLHSHQGLTYGGWILPRGHVDGNELLGMFMEATSVWKDLGITELDYKPMPYIYFREPAQEDLYALFRLGAVTCGCGLSASVDLRDTSGFDKMQRRHLRKAEALDWHISEERDSSRFMNLLKECLKERHGVSPVHTNDEMKLLTSRFPDNIRIFALYMADTPDIPQAGVCIYDTGIVAHAQYIAATQRARDLNLMAPLFHTLINDIFSSRRYFDFGISTEENGMTLNAGLLRQKFSYGASGVIYPRYRLSLV